MGAKLPKELRLNNVCLNRCSSQCFYTSQWRCPYPVYLAYRWILALYTVSAFIYMVVVIQQLHTSHPAQSHSAMVYLTSWAYLALTCHFVLAAVITSICSTKRNPHLDVESPGQVSSGNLDMGLKSLRTKQPDTSPHVCSQDVKGTPNSDAESTGKGSRKKDRKSKYLRGEERYTVLPVIASGTGKLETVNKGISRCTETRQLEQDSSIVTHVSEHGSTSEEPNEDDTLERDITDSIGDSYKVDDYPLNTSHFTNVEHIESGHIVPDETIDNGSDVERDRTHRDLSTTNNANGSVDGNEVVSTDGAVIPWYCKLSWVLANISSTFSLVVTGIYFGAMFKGSFRDIFNDVNTHILNAVLAILDNFISARPTRILHVVYSLGFGSLYLIFSVVFWAVDPRNVIYPGLTDWNNPGVSSAVSAIIAFLIFIFHGLHFVMYKIRLRIFYRIYRPRAH